MATHLLKELLDTRYFYISIEKDFSHVTHTVSELASNKSYPYFAGNDAQQKLFEDVIAGNDIVFDICDMRITSDCTPLITNAIRKGFKFIDSKDDYRNGLLVGNQSRKPVPEAVPLPKYNPTTDPVKYIRELDKNVIYELPKHMSNLDIALVILITMSRPKIQFTLDTAQGVVFDTVAEVITVSVLCNYTEFYYNSPEGIEVLKLEGNMLHTQRRGWCSIVEACEAGSLVPTAFGKEKLINNPMWEPLVNVCLAAVNSSHKASPKTLRDVLKGVS